MRNPESSEAAALLVGWQADLRDSLATELDPDRIEALAAGVAALSGTTAITAASTAIAQGGTTMLNTTTAATTTAAGAGGATAGAAATGSMTAKIAAGAIAASLVGGGAAAVTGNLPAAMQSFVADTGAHIGLDLPRPEANVGLTADLGLGLGAGEIVDLGAPGRLSATVDASAGLVLTGVEEATGFTAAVLSRTSDSVMVEFRSATETATVLLTNVDGQIVASFDGDAELHGSAGGFDAADGRPGPGADADGTAQADSSASGEAGNASVGVATDSSIRIGVGR